MKPETPPEGKRTMLYILENQKVTPVHNVLAWKQWFNTADKTIARTMLIHPDCEISTVFLGVDHRFGHGPPLIFETMIFGGDHDGYQRRYATIQQAKEGHAQIVSALRNDLPLDSD